jgi:hypothetical protein
MILQPLDLAIGAILGGHLVLSALFQFGDTIRKRLGAIAEILTLPTWTFFAPNPGVNDYRLVARIKSTSDPEWGPWCELDIGWQKSRLRWLWNPSKIAHKALTDCLQILLMSILELPHDSGMLVYLTRPYLTILAYVRRYLNTARDKRFQFAVIQTHGFTAPRSLQPLFLSLTHSSGD